jgi:hypothetical protein
MDWKKLFYYDDGDLIWRARHGPRAAPGSIAGRIESKGYRQVCIEGTYYLVHRVIWEMHNSTITNGLMIDHINGIKDDNRIENLRLCTASQNLHNTPKRRNNTSGYKGVSWEERKQQWSAKIRLNGGSKHIGYFDTAEEAYEAYCEVANRCHGEFVNLA